MNPLQTFKLWLEPDRTIPQFMRLHWHIVSVSLEDVLLHGVHPWFGPSGHPTLPDAFLRIVNSDATRIPELAQFHYCHDVSGASEYGWNKPSKFETTLKAVQEHVYFVDDLSYLELLDIAKARLRKMWTHSLVRDMARSAYPSFQELRQFLKSKDRGIKLSSYEDLDQYDLSLLLTLEDLAHKDHLIVSEALSALNFRKTALLEKVADSQGRLRLRPEIRHLTLTGVEHEPVYFHGVWHVAREGSMWRFRPDIGNDTAKRRYAQEFAAQWRIDQGRLCFSTTTEKLIAMVEQNHLTPSFPALNYDKADSGPLASAAVAASQVDVFSIGKFVGSRNTSSQLKDILCLYHISMTGNKEQLVQKLATLATEKYRESLPEMNAFFSQCRFVRMRSAPVNASKLPLLEDLSFLKNLVLTMYAIKHLRGNAILDAAHRNDTYSDGELALALIDGKTGLEGGFLRIA